MTIIRICVECGNEMWPDAPPKAKTHGECDE